MQTVSQTINDLSYVMGIPRTRVNTIARELIDAGVLPKSSGRDIKLIDATQLCGFVCALAMADKAAEAREVAETIMALRLSGESHGEKFKTAFAANINTSQDDAAPTLTFSKMPSGFSVEMDGSFIHDGELSVGNAPYWSDRSWGGWTKTSFSLSGEGFRILRNLFNRAYDDDGRPVYRSIG